MDLDLAHVRSFLAVVDYGGYHRAAEALHLSQPAVSQHVRRLEARVGGPLFVRRGRGVDLSPHGEAVAAELRQVVAAHDRALARLARGADGAGPFRVGAVEHLVDPLLPDLLATLRERLGARSVQLRIDRSRRLTAAQRAGELDAAIVMDPSGAPDPQELGSVRLHWWGGSDLLRAPLPDPLPVVAYDPPCGLRDMALRHLDRAGVAATVAAQSQHLTGIQAAVRAGMGVALLAAGADGLRRVDHPALSEPLHASLWLVAGSEHRELAEPLRRALWAASSRLRVRPAA